MHISLLKVRNLCLVNSAHPIHLARHLPPKHRRSSRRRRFAHWAARRSAGPDPYSRGDGDLEADLSLRSQAPYAISNTHDLHEPFWRLRRLPGDASLPTSLFGLDEPQTLREGATRSVRRSAQAIAAFLHNQLRWPQSLC